MWWDKKPEPIPPKTPWVAPPPPAPPSPQLEKPMTDRKPLTPSPTLPNRSQTIIGPSMLVRGEISGTDDLQVEGQFEGTISVQDHCVTVGPQGEVKAEIRARQVVIQGTVNGNVSAGEKIEIRKSGHVVGDLLTAAIAIEEGAYFKGSINILRDGHQDLPQPLSTAGIPRPREAESPAPETPLAVRLGESAKMQS